MSNETNKNFRRSYAGIESPGAYESWGELPDGTLRQGVIHGGVFTLSEEYRENSKFVALDVGSTAVIGANEDTYEILAVHNDYTAILGVDPGVSTSVPVPIRIVRANTPSNVVAYLTGVASSIASRRFCLVWCDSPYVETDTKTVKLPVKYLASEIAGIRCSLLPQQGLTRTSLASATSAPTMYTKFTPAQLDIASAGGVFVVAQEYDEGPVFVRHQITTDTEHGPLAYEDSVGVVVDEFSYWEKDAFESYIGRRNVTAETVNELRVKLQAMAIRSTKVDLADREIGPMVIRFFSRDGNEGEVTVEVDQHLSDHVNTYVLLRVPLPLNGIHNYVDVETSTEL
jgi:hypothetical protein